MAMQKTPHNSTEQDVNSDEMDLEPNMAPQDTLRVDPELYANTDGAQTAGNRSFHSTAGRDNQPKSLDEGTENTGPSGTTLPQGDGHGVTNAAAGQERATQEKVVGKQ